MYAGPLRDEPIAIELHNTIYAREGARRDGLAQPGWLEAIGDRLPAGGRGRKPTRAELAALRETVRAALHAALDGTPHDPDVLAALNAAAARAPQSPAAVWHRDADPTPAVDHHGATRADIVLAAFAADAIALITGADRTRLGGCHAPGCVLMFVKSHPRREWCSNACGNRARQARHYARSKQ
jgi:predicted RNA-binding Zn ribbon-like protein